MRHTIYDYPITFKANSAIVAAAEKRAHAAGMSLAELMRAKLREAAGVDFMTAGEAQ